MTLDDFVQKLGPVEGGRDGMLAHCPAHDDAQASLRVTVSDKGKVLVKCRAGCETRDVMAALGMSLRDLATMTADGDLDFAPATSTDAPASAADVARLAVDLDRWAAVLADDLTAEAQAALRYAEGRFGIDADDATRLGLGAATDLPGGPRLVVPFRDKDGVPRGYQARALTDDAKIRWYGPKSPEGASWAKLGWLEGGSGWSEVVITEGPSDGLTSAGIGYDTILVAGAGQVSNPNIVAQISDWLGDRPAIIAGDGDPAGRRFASTLGQELASAGHDVRLLAVPDGEDVSSWREQAPSRFSTEFVRGVLAAEPVTAADAALHDRDEQKYPLTDLGNARYVRDFIAAQGSGVRYSPEAGFFLLEDGVWRQDTLDRTRAYVQDAAERVAKIAASLAESAVSDEEKKRAGRWVGWARHSQSSRGIDAAIRELQALRQVSIDVNAFDTHAHLLAARNGVIDLRTGELMPHDPDLLITRRVNVNYDPDARAPRWERFLQEVFPSRPELPAYMQRLVGYGITGSVDEQCFAVHWGTGANGKSVFTDTLAYVFEELTETTPFSTFEDKGSSGIPNDIAALKGARLVMAAEGEQGRPMAEAVLKRVTGRDLIAARFMRREFFTFRPTFLLMLATNFKPSFRGQDDGLWRRVKLIPWERKFEPHERDHHLGRKLQKEAEGILAWAVRGAVEWYRAGLQDPADVRDATSEYRETSDQLTGFLPGLFVKADLSQKVLGAQLWEAYTQWAQEEGLPAREIWTRKTFFAALEERQLVKKKTAKGIAFFGVRRARQADVMADAEDDEAAREAAPESEPTITPPAGGPSLEDVL